MAWLEGRLRKGSTARRWRRDESGAVAITVALAGLVMVVIAGAAIDMGIYVLRREQVSAAVDAALTSAVSTAYRTEADGKSVEQSAEAGAAAGQALYVANTTTAPDVQHKDLTIDVDKKTVSSVPTWAASASVDASYTTYFLKIIAVKTLPIKLTAASAVSVKNSMDYWEFTLLVDVSQSMGIASTRADMDRMLAYDGCFFACHQEGTNTRMDILRGMGIDFRIDAVNRAVAAFAESVKKTMTGNAKVALHTFATVPTLKIAMTSEIDSLANVKIELPFYTPSDAARILQTSQGVTNLAVALGMVDKSMTSAGDGSSFDKPKKALFLITDGLHDMPVKNTFFTTHSYANGLHHMGPVNPTFCQKFKDKGILVSVLYVTYFSADNATIDGDRQAFLELEASLEPKLRECASSPALFFEAGESAGIKDALQKMLKAVSGSGNVRLTN